MQKIHKLPENSSFIGKLPEGCKYCGPGQKMVLLITGRCACRCFYCPLSFKKRGKDVIYANELNVTKLDEILLEAKAISAKGTGITGGDPMHRPELTLRAIKLLKKNFGDEHHIHLYTAGKFKPDYITKLASAGLDELRVHPPVHTWKNIRSDFKYLIRSALKTEMLVGSEIPVLPGYENIIFKYIHSLDLLGVNFLNLNELEFSESNWENLHNRGYEQKDQLANTVKDSESLAMKILTELSREHDLEMNIHYCSARFKDRQQLTNRLKRRAKNTKKPYYLLTDDGTFLIGIIEASPSRNIKDLLGIRNILLKEYDVPGKLMNLNTNLNRLEVAPWVLEGLRVWLEDKLGERCFIIEEYPTADRLEVERIPLYEFK